MKHCTFFFTLFLFTVWSCRENMDITTIVSDEPEPPDVFVHADISGVITNIGGNPLQGATILLGEAETTTNEEGLFQLRGVKMDAEGDQLLIDKPSFFRSSATVYPAAGGQYFCKAVLLFEEFTEFINTSEGGTLEVRDARVSLPGNAIVDSDDETVDGNIRVHAEFLSSSNTRFAQAMPGPMTGRDAEGATVALIPYGLMAVKLQSLQGEALKLAESRPATLSFPVAADMLAQAPAFVPLWHYDEATSSWVEEGEARLEGGNYVGEVPHFSYWLVALPSGTTTVSYSGCVVYPDEAPAAYHEFSVLDNNNQLLAYGFTDIDGNIQGPVPAGLPLTVRVELPCDDDETFSIGPFTDNAEDIDCLGIEAASPNTLSGQLVDCEGQPLSSEMLQLMVEDSRWYTTSDADGRFIFYNVRCDPGTEGILTGYHVGEQLTSEPTAYTLDGQIDVGEISVCAAPDEYLTVQADIYGGQSFTFVLLGLDEDNPNAPYDIGCEGGDSEGGGYFFGIGFPSLEVGVYSTGERYIDYTYYPEWPNSEEMRASCFFDCTELSVEITLNEGPGGYLEGLYSAVVDGWDSVNDEPLQDISLSGEFRVKQ